MAPTTALWTDAYLKDIAAEVIQSATSTYEGDSCWFWYENDKGAWMIDKATLLASFFPLLGIRNLVVGNTDKSYANRIPVFLLDNRIAEVDANILESLTFKVLGFIYEMLQGDDGFPEYKKVKVALGLSKDIWEKGLKIPPNIEGKTFLKDTASSAYRFFKNGWVEITKDGVSPLKDYADIPEDKMIWNTSVIARDYLPEVEGSATHYRDFLENLAKDDDGNVCPNNLKRIKAGLGYLTHRFHFADCRPFVEVLDREFDVTRRHANGGNGKSILLSSLRNVVCVGDVDGKEFKKSRSDKFAFANINLSTEVVFFDDCDEKFDFKRLFGRTTGNFELHSMRNNPVSIPAADAPKMCASTNYPIGDNDWSTNRRKYVIEVSSHYRDMAKLYKQTPAAIHGGKMIAYEGGGWNKADWSHFYHVINECIALYLADGLPADGEMSENYVRSQLLASIAGDSKGIDAEALLDFYLEYLYAAAEDGDVRLAHAFYKEVRDAFPALPADWNNQRLYEQLVEVGAAYQVNPNWERRGKQKQIRIGIDNGMWQKWVDAGLEDTLNKQGKKFEVGAAVGSFSVSNLAKPTKATFSAPDFTHTDDAEVTDEEVVMTD